MGQREGYSAEFAEITMDTPIPSSNIGFQLLLKMGWKEQMSLGRFGQGIYDPLRIEVKDDNLGLGQKEIDEYWTAKENFKRRTMNSERNETEEEKKEREEKNEQVEKRKKEVNDIHRPFYCELCDKQYKRATEFDTHLSSYDHHHTKRLKETKEMHAKIARKDAPKTRKREEQLEHQNLLKQRNLALARQLESSDENKGALSTNLENANQLSKFETSSTTSSATHIDPTKRIGKLSFSFGKK